jgi:hypothetical protein
MTTCGHCQLCRVILPTNVWPNNVWLKRSFDRKSFDRKFIWSKSTFLYCQIIFGQMAVLVKRYSVKGGAAKWSKTLRFFQQKTTTIIVVFSTKILKIQSVEKNQLSVSFYWIFTKVTWSQTGCHILTVFQFMPDFIQISPS